jgi:hypothetical protein
MWSQTLRVAFGLTVAILAMPLHALPATVTVAVPANLAKDKHSLVLRVDNVKLPPHSSGIVRVFADFPGANTETATEDERFLGYFTILAKDSAEAAQGAQRSGVSLDVSHKKQFLTGKKTVTLTLVPLGRPSGSDAAGHNTLTFSRVYFSQD